MPGAHAEDVAAPAADETLIYLLRVGNFGGGGTRLWLAVNDQTVAKLKNKRYSVVRAKAGSITLSLAIMGLVTAAIALDDRPGETVYLKWRVGDKEIIEVDEAEGKEFLRKAKQMKPIDPPLDNNEQVAALMNLSRLGFDLMRPAMERLSPDDEHALVTIFRRHQSDKLDFGIWSEHRYLGTLSANQGLEVLVPAGNHFFLSGYRGTTLLQAQVDAGKRYYARLAIGKMISRVRLTPVALEQSDDLNKWLTDIDWVEVNPDAITPRIQERVDMVTVFVRSTAERAKIGAADFHLLASENAY
jgi:hypothetical protein